MNITYAMLAYVAYVCYVGIVSGRYVGRPRRASLDLLFFFTPLLTKIPTYGYLVYGNHGNFVATYVIAYDVIHYLSKTNEAPASTLL